MKSIVSIHHLYHYYYEKSIAMACLLISGLAAVNGSFTSCTTRFRCRSITSFKPDLGDHLCLRSQEVETNQVMQKTSWSHHVTIIEWTESEGKRNTQNPNRTCTKVATSILMATFILLEVSYKEFDKSCCSFPSVIIDCDVGRIRMSGP